MKKKFNTYLYTYFMEYKQKYLKYKNKYINLKKQFDNSTQFGSGKESHRGLNQNILLRTSTGESPEDRALREARNIHPVDGYRIFENIDEIIYGNFSPQSAILDTIRANLNELMGELYFTEEGYPINLYYIDARGDGNCFLNCLFIFTMMIPGKTDIMFELYTITGIRESNPANFNDFKSSILFLANTFLDSKISEYGDAGIVEILKNDLIDPNIPSVETFGKIYCDNYNVNILVVQVNDRTYKYISHTILRPEVPNEATDYVILIQMGNIHFRMLIPRDSDLALRRYLYEKMLNIIGRIRR